MVARGGLHPLPGELRRQRRGRDGARQGPRAGAPPDHAAGPARRRDSRLPLSARPAGDGRGPRGLGRVRLSQQHLDPARVLGDEVVGFFDVFDTRERDYNEVRPFLSSAARTVADALRNAAPDAEPAPEQRRPPRARRAERPARRDGGSRAPGAHRLGAPARHPRRRGLRHLGASRATSLRCLASFDSRGWDAGEIGKERSLPDYPSVRRGTVRRRPARDRRPRGRRSERARARDRTAAGATGAWSRCRSWSKGAPSGSSTSSTPRCATSRGSSTSSATWAGCSAAALEKAGLIERLESGNRDLRLLVDSGLEFGSSLDVDAVIVKVAERILTVSQAEMCDVYGVVGEDAEILYVGGRTRRSHHTRHAVRDARTSPCSTKARTARRPVIVLDVLADPSSTAADRARRRDAGATGRP